MMVGQEDPLDLSIADPGHEPVQLFRPGSPRIHQGEAIASQDPAIGMRGRRERGTAERKEREILLGLELETGHLETQP